MTPKEIEKYKKYISDVKRALAAEKRKFGFYHDGRGMRYYPPKAYIKLKDYKGGLSYFKWFAKNFPDDMGYPDFLLEWTFILFVTNNLRNAEQKAFETFCANTYLFDKFFDRPIIHIDKYEFSNIQNPSYAASIEYSYQQVDFKEFGEWLTHYLQSEKFKQLSSKFIELQKRIKYEKNSDLRSALINESWQLSDEA